ncbi:DUF5642 family protein [Rhodococcus xishaensis]|uniref:Sensor domain-containing protein n=1 Tax=Rhodococcus xishaensis TaxID=2487364 RepID=A0A3S3AGC9_9NOCA|nr:DUF5642 family protein [Rhodococcus xishaensis]RVW03956.1 sensor domain-containing protein [Rhodococcus xishaensis]
MSTRTRLAPILVLGSVVLGAGALPLGCSTKVDGAARPVGDDLSSSRALAELLLEPSSFPPQYSAIVLPPQAVSQAAPDLAGIPPGARVDPAGCKPPAQDYGTDGTAMVVGTDNVNRSTITIELVRVQTPLADLGARVAECPEVTATRSGVESTVTTVLTPAPPIDADETLALHRTVNSGRGEQEVTQSMLTLFAQVGEVRVQATSMSFGAAADTANLDAATHDTATLDELFRSAVLKVRAG